MRGSDWLTRSRLSPMALASRRFVVHAAEAANLPQAAAPKVSGQIEKAWGAKLFSRRALGVIPTLRCQPNCSGRTTS